MSRKFKPGDSVMQKPAGIPMTVTMYANKAPLADGRIGEIVCVTWAGISGRTRTAKFAEDMLLPFPFPEWTKGELGR